MSNRRRVIFYILVGTLVGAMAGYAFGFLIGLALTFWNNHFLTGVPTGGYLWWGNFVGIIMAFFLGCYGLIGTILAGGSLALFEKLRIQNNSELKSDERYFRKR